MLVLITILRHVCVSPLILRNSSRCITRVINQNQANINHSLNGIHVNPDYFIDLDADPEDDHNIIQDLQQFCLENPQIFLGFP
jgi:hypothetical protein